MNNIVLVFFVLIYSHNVFSTDFHNYEDYRNRDLIGEFCEKVTNWYENSENVWLRAEYYGGVFTCAKLQDSYKNLDPERKKEFRVESYYKYQGLIDDAALSGIKIPEYLIYKFFGSPDPEINEIIKKQRFQYDYKKAIVSEERDHPVYPWIYTQYRDMWMPYLEANRVDDAMRILADYAEFLCDSGQLPCEETANKRDVRNFLDERFENDKKIGKERYLKKSRERKAR